VIAGEVENEYITYNSNKIIEEEIFTKLYLRTICVKPVAYYNIRGKLAYLLI